MILFVSLVIITTSFVWQCVCISIKTKIKSCSNFLAMFPTLNSYMTAMAIITYTFSTFNFTQLMFCKCMIAATIINGTILLSAISAIV